MGLTDGCDKELEVVRTLTTQSSDLAILVLDNQPSLDRLTLFLLAGARGYFSIEVNLNELLASLDFNAAGLFSVDARLAVRFRPELEPSMPEHRVELALEDKLTPKELELLHLLKEGKTNQEIADALNLRPSTIKTLSHRLFIKLGAKNRLQAVVITSGN